MEATPRDLKIQAEFNTLMRIAEDAYNTADDRADEGDVRRMARPLHEIASLSAPVCDTSAPRYQEARAMLQRYHDMLAGSNYAEAWRAAVNTVDLLAECRATYAEANPPAVPADPDEWKDRAYLLARALHTITQTPGVALIDENAIHPTDAVELDAAIDTMREVLDEIEEPPHPWYCSPEDCITPDCAAHGQPDTCAERPFICSCGADLTKPGAVYQEAREAGTWTAHVERDRTGEPFISFDRFDTDDTIGSDGEFCAECDAPVLPDDEDTDTEEVAR